MHLSRDTPFTYFTLPKNVDAHAQDLDSGPYSISDAAVPKQFRPYRQRQQLIVA